MKLRDWRQLSSSAMAGLYRKEHMHWRRTLAWDTDATWRTVEQARVTWGLPGLVCVNEADEICGWTFFVGRRQYLELGGLVADTAAATERLLEGVVEQARLHSGLRGFIHTRAPGLPESLARHGITLDPHLYLSRLLDPGAGGGLRLDTALFRASRARATSTVDVRGWVDGDLDATAALLREAYGEGGYLFAPANAPSEWREYVDSLVRQTGCGVLSPELSRVIALNGRIQAVAIVTTLSSRTVHLAQLAVAPALRRHGVAAGLMAEVAARARRSGYTLLSLIVSRRNQAACELYRRLGLIERGQFFELHADDLGTRVKSA